MTLSTKIIVSLAAALTSAGDLGNISQSVATGRTFSLTDGTGANQANKIFGDTRTLAASASESLDLAGGLTDAFGASITFTKIKAIVVIAAAGNTNNVVVGGAASLGFSTPFGDASDTINVLPGGAFVLVAPGANAYAVTAATGDLLKIANSSSGTGVTYDIVLVGV